MLFSPANHPLHPHPVPDWLLIVVTLTSGGSGGRSVARYGGYSSRDLYSCDGRHLKNQQKNDPFLTTLESPGSRGHDSELRGLSFSVASCVSGSALQLGHQTTFCFLIAPFISKCLLVSFFFFLMFFFLYVN